MSLLTRTNGQRDDYKPADSTDVSKVESEVKQDTYPGYSPGIRRARCCRVRDGRRGYSRANVPTCEGEGGGRRGQHRGRRRALQRATAQGAGSTQRGC